MAERVNLLVDLDRLTEYLTVDDYLGILEGDVKIQIAALSKFVSDGNGNYLEPEEGRKEIGKIPIFALAGVVNEFMQLVTDAASPPVKGSD